MREAQAALLGAFDRADTVTAAQLHAAAAGFSERTANRGRANLTRDGLLIRGKRGMDGEVTYTIDRRQLAAAAGNGSSWPFPRRNRQRARMADNAFAAFSAAEYDDADNVDDIDDETDYDSARAAGSAWGWIVTIAVFVCGLVWVRRRFVSLAIGNAAGTGSMSLQPFTGGAGVVPVPRAPRTYEIVAPYPGDDAIYGPEPAPEEIWEPDLVAGPNAYETFAAFPGVFGFSPGSNT